MSLLIFPRFHIKIVNIFFLLIFCFEILQSERNDFSYVFVTIFYIILENFRSKWINSFTIVVKRQKKIKSKHMPSEKSINSF